MALYRPLEPRALEQLCERFGLSLQSARGVAEGSINTNYSLDCAEGRFFLRFTHVRQQDELAFEAALLSHLHQGHFCCPRPLPASDRKPFTAFEDGFVSIFPFEPGEHLGRGALTPEHAFRAGETLGRMHRLAASFSLRRSNPYGEPVVTGWLDALEDGSRQLRPLGGEVEEALPMLRKALERSRQAGALPLGTLHADYFRDNVKWLGDRISAVLDFEMACTGPWMLDVGIGLCEWAWDGRFDPARLAQFMEGYQAATPPQPDQLAGLYEMTLFAGVRYSLSRIRDFHLSPLPADALTPKDWRRYRDRTLELLQMEEAGFLRACGLQD